MTDTEHSNSPTTAQHTPGPWVYDLRQGMYPAVKIGNEWQRIYVPAPLHHVHECEANARLIAAAPDLLAALKYVRSEITLNHAPICPKAHGGEHCLCDLDAFEQRCDAAIARAESRQP